MRTGRRSRQESCQLPAVQTRSEERDMRVDWSGSQQQRHVIKEIWEIFPLNVIIIYQ